LSYGAPIRPLEQQPMEDTTYGIRTSTHLPFDAAIEQTTAALKQEGFGVITTIDMQATLKAKLGKNIRRYTILGACNPTLADRALQAEAEVGLLLPCNVVVYEHTPGDIVVSAMAPIAALGMVGENAALAEVAQAADAGLRRALKSLEQVA
jgi:uncharacterized protein (DUF302 family)